MRVKTILDRIKSNEQLKLYKIVTEVNGITFESVSIHSIEGIKKLGFKIEKP